MGELVGPRLYSCHKCRNHVSLHDDIISKAFQVKHLIFCEQFIPLLLKVRLRLDGWIRIWKRTSNDAKRRN